MIAAMLIVLGAGYLSAALQLAVQLLLGRRLGLRYSFVSLGFPSLIRVRLGGVQWRFGPLPTSYAKSEPTESGVMLRGSAWQDPEAQRLVQEQQLAATRLRDSRRFRSMELAGAVVPVLLGLWLTGPREGLWHFMLHPRDVLLEAWPPWSSGADAVKRALWFLARQPRGAAVGVVLVRSASWSFWAGALRYLSLRLFSSTAIDGVLFVLLSFVPFLLWSVALLCSFWR